LTESVGDQAGLSGEASVVVSKGQISCSLADEAVILDFNAGIYYGLNPVAARVWTLIQEPRTVAEIRDALLAEFEVDADRCERDLRELLHDLRAKDLVRIKDAVPA
jgi:hypothetical protein